MMFHAVRLSVSLPSAAHALLVNITRKKIWLIHGVNRKHSEVSPRKYILLRGTYFCRHQTRCSAYVAGIKPVRPLSLSLPSDRSILLIEVLKELDETLRGGKENQRSFQLHWLHTYNRFTYTDEDSGNIYTVQWKFSWG